MLLRSSLARSLQYAMANMADIKTPLCALQPTPAIPHTASRSGAGTRRRRRGGRGSAGSRPGAGTKRASRQPPEPASPASRARLLAAPARGAPGGGRDARTPGAHLSVLLSVARTRSLSHTRSLPAPLSDGRRCRRTTAIRTPALRKARAGEWPGGAVAPGSTARTPSPPSAASREAGATGAAVPAERQGGAPEPGADAYVSYRGV